MTEPKRFRLGYFDDERCKLYDDPEGAFMLYDDYAAHLRRLAEAGTQEAERDRFALQGAHLCGVAKSLGWKDDGESALNFIARHERQRGMDTAPPAPSVAVKVKAVDCDWPAGSLFKFLDEPGDHDPCYVVMPDGACLTVNHHATPGVDIARAKFIVSACNAALITAPQDDVREALERHVLPSDETRPHTQKAREMLAEGINIQAVGDATNVVVSGVIRSLIDHIDELEADLKAAIAVGRLAAKTSSRPEVSVEELARFITPNPDECVFGSGSVGFGPDGKVQSSFNCAMYAWEKNLPLARALKAKYHMEGRE